ncbi:MAG: hypothetical protein M3022_12875 [Actinomycetota bacterium]|nr:hypothetical protein [Actinomycetota bacterium]
MTRRPSSETEALLAALADRQHGVFALGQLDGNDWLRAAVGRRGPPRPCGRLRRLHHGVYAYGHRRLTPSGHRLAEVLACGPGAVLSHRSAATLWELLATARTRIDVTVPGTSRRTRTGVHLHRTRELRPGDVAVIDGVPVTTVNRTLCDLAGVVSRARLQRAVEQAERSNVLDLSTLQRAVDRHPTRRGTGSLRAVLDDYTPAPLMRSALERSFRELLQAASLPMPLTNHVVAGYEVDAYWPQWHLVVELDGRAYHSDPRAFERDPVRDARLMRQVPGAAGNR